MASNDDFLTSIFNVGFDKNDFNSSFPAMVVAICFISALTASAFPASVANSNIALAYLMAALDIID